MHKDKNVHYILYVHFYFKLLDYKVKFVQSKGNLSSDGAHLTFSNIQSVSPPQKAHTYIYAVTKMTFSKSPLFILTPYGKNLIPPHTHCAP